MVSGRGSGGKRNFWNMGEKTACLYAGSLDPTERRKLMMGGGCREPQRNVLGERGDGGPGEGDLAGVCTLPRSN